MNKRQFVRRRRSDWKRFEFLVERMERARFSSIPSREITEFSRLFRELSNDLAIIRSREWGRDLDDYLNHLVGRGHNTFYSAPPADYAKVFRYLTRGFPRLFRANIGYFLAAACLFFIPGAISWAVIQTHPHLATRVVAIEQLEQIDAMYGGARGSSDEDAEKNTDSDDETTDDWDNGFGEERAGMYGFYIYNNVGIALACFARGVLLGVGTVYTLLFNGIVIGAIGGYVVSQGNAPRFLSFVVSHGSFELTAIAVAGGAGLMLGNAILHPGERSRIEALRVRGLEAVQIACGAAVMLVVAALIEAFWSPSGVPAGVKYAVGAGLWLLVFLYLSLAGRGR
jgi:uncharacterized membrane protein SpoIIM required for sporulation